ncbi:hypothetical protein GCM10009593_03970 [Microlunatus antarcticus]
MCVLSSGRGGHQAVPSSVSANGWSAAFVTRGEEAHRTGNADAPPPTRGDGASKVVPGRYWLGMDPEVVAPASIEW